MSIPVAVTQLLETESNRRASVLSPHDTLAIALSRVGGGNDQRIVAGSLQELSNADEHVFGEPLHSLVIVGKRLHHLEVEFAEAFAQDRKTWRDVAQRVYACNMD
jgi:diphthine methyl ester synthase